MIVSPSTKFFNTKKSFYITKKLFGAIDKYIGLRYNQCIGRRYIARRNIFEGAIMQNPPLTEAVYYILLSLIKPMHGYGIMQNTEALSHGRVRLAAGTLYGALNTLVEKGLIISLPEESGRKKEYVITELGKKVLQSEIQRLRELLENGTNILGG